MNEENKPIIKKLDRCPCCGSTERFAGSVAKEQGLENAEAYGLNAFSGPVGDQKKLQSAPFGTKFPIITAVIDVCTGVRDDGSVCGCVYAIRLETHIATKMIPPAAPGGRGSPIIPPFGPHFEKG